MKTLLIMLTALLCAPVAISAEPDAQATTQATTATTTTATTTTATTKTVTLKPTMRAVSRDWRYFKALPCDALQRTATHTHTEKKLLQRRRAECLSRYKAFMPER